MGGSGGGQGGPRFGNTAQAANPQIADPMQNLNNSGAPNFPRQGGMRPPPPRTNSGEGMPGFRPIPPQGIRGTMPGGQMRRQPMPKGPGFQGAGITQGSLPQFSPDQIKAYQERLAAERARFGARPPVDPYMNRGLDRMENQIRTEGQLGRMGTPLPVSGGGGTQINAPEQKPQIGPDGNAYMIIGGNRVDLGPPGSQKYNSFFEPIQQIDNLRPYRPIGGMPPTGGGSIDMQQPERERQQRIQQLMSSLQGGGAGGK